MDPPPPPLGFVQGHVPGLIWVCGAIMFGGGKEDSGGKDIPTAS